jgi:hypothetical protein
MLTPPICGVESFPSLGTNKVRVLGGPRASGCYGIFRPFVYQQHCVHAARERVT